MRVARADFPGTIHRRSGFAFALAFRRRRPLVRVRTRRLCVAHPGRCDVARGSVYRTWNSRAGRMRKKPKTTATRSAIMRAVRSKHTGPELALRRLLSAMGYRYRLHASSLPGKPDFCFGRRRKIVFLHGCFWHQHRGCKKSGVPKSNIEYWRPKLRRNVERDHEAQRALRQLGWKVLVIWQCKLKKENALRFKLRKFLGPSSRKAKRGTANSASP